MCVVARYDEAAGDSIIYNCARLALPKAPYDVVYDIVVRASQPSVHSVVACAPSKLPNRGSPAAPVRR